MWPFRQPSRRSRSPVELLDLAGRIDQNARDATRAEVAEELAEMRRTLYAQADELTLLRAAQAMRITDAQVRAYREEAR